MWLSLQYLPIFSGHNIYDKLTTRAIDDDYMTKTAKLNHQAICIDC